MQTLSISAFQSLQTLKSSSAQSWTFNTLREKTNRYNYKQSNQTQRNANGYLFNQTRSQTHTYKPSAARLQKQAKRKKRNCNNHNGSGQSNGLILLASSSVLYVIIMVTQPPPYSSHLLYIQHRSVSICLCVGDPEACCLGHYMIITGIQPPPNTWHNYSTFSTEAAPSESLKVSSGYVSEILKPACRWRYIIITDTEQPPYSSHLLYIQYRSGFILCQHVTSTWKRPLVQMQDLWHIARWHLLTLWWTHFCTECRVHVNCTGGFGGRGGWGGAFKESRGV